MTIQNNGQGKTPDVVVITGASAGVGRATVREFARHGAYIGLIARGRDGLEQASREVEAAGGRALVLPVDVSRPDEVESAASIVEEKLGPIDIWVNNAMVSVFSPVKYMTAEEFRRVTEVTYLGVVHGTMAALKRMLPRDAGNIVQVGSALAYRGIPLQAAYCASKHAIQGFCDSLRTELLHDGSKVNLTMVQMPALNTPQFTWTKNHMPHEPQPVPPIYEPEIAARAIYWAAHSRKREICVAPSTIMAIVGDKIAPALLDHYLARWGYESQQTDKSTDPNQSDDLWEALPGDYGAHGKFDRIARKSSLQLWLNLNRSWLALAGTLAGSALAFALVRRNWRI